MSIWTRISEALAALAKGQGLSAIFENLKQPPEKSVAFTIAVIALGAKMAKADGEVTRDEVIAFRQIFQIAPEDEIQAARVFNLARQDVAGYEIYARNIARMFAKDSDILSDLIEGLFHISMADGHYHPSEDAFINEVSTIFGMPAQHFTCLRSRYVPGAEPDPYSVLEIAHGTDIGDIRKAWRRKVHAVHPDNLIARGLPAEAIALANSRLIIINNAWEEIKQSHVAA
ncbi:MAG: molecular chaperone DjiA [Paracoccaceae bacterium]